MRYLIILLLFSSVASAQTITKYRVYLKTGMVEFKDFYAANKFANENYADSVKLVTVIPNQFFIDDSIAIAKKNAVIGSLKSNAYNSLQGVTVGSTLTSAQLQRIAWISLWNTGAINPATNKIDSALNYIK